MEASSAKAAGDGAALGSTVSAPSATAGRRGVPRSPPAPTSSSRDAEDSYPGTFDDCTYLYLCMRTVGDGHYSQIALFTSRGIGEISTAVHRLCLTCNLYANTLYFD